MLGLLIYFKVNTGIFASDSPLWFSKNFFLIDLKFKH